MGLIFKAVIAFCIGTVAVVALEHHWFSFMATQTSQRQLLADARMAPIPGLDTTSAIDSQSLRPLGRPTVTPLDMSSAKQAAAESRTRQLDLMNPGRSAFPQAR